MICIITKCLRRKETVVKIRTYSLTMLIVCILFAQLFLVHRTSIAHAECKNFCNGSDEGNVICWQSIGDEILENIVDNTTVILCTAAVTQQKLIHIANKTNITLRGLPVSHTEIQCHGNESGYRFINVTNLILSQIVFMNCANPSLDIQVTTPWLSGIWFYFCENVQLTSISIRNSTGTGMALIDTVGYTEIYDSTFENNNDKYNSFSLGGGVYIKFSLDNVRKDVYQSHSRDCHIVFRHNTFTNNSALSFDKQQQSQEYDKTSKQRGSGGGLNFYFEDHDTWCNQKVIEVIDCQFDQNAAHHGGGMSIIFTSNTTRNNVTLKHCTFTNNTANFGGGLFLVFAYNPYHNFITLTDTHFYTNHAENGGGGIKISFHLKQLQYPQNNTVLLDNCNIIANQAQYGGGTVLHFIRILVIDQKNTVTFINCLWKENTAQFGSAVEASLHTSDILSTGCVVSPVFKNCQFLTNYRSEETYNKGQLARMMWGKGVFLATSLPITFTGKTTFFGSNTSALYASSSIINFTVGSNVTFTNNIGYEGGALYLIGLSELHMQDNSTFIFNNNTALTKGGAIMHRSMNKLDFIASKHCFIRYVGNTKHISERSIVLVFENNTALGHYETPLGHTIYATTIIPCGKEYKQQKAIEIFVGCIGNVTFRNNRMHEISTEGALFDSPPGYIMPVIPGREVELNFKLLDDNQKEVHGSYHVSVKNMFNSQTSIRLDPAYSYIRGKTIKLFGKPGDKANIFVGTENFREISLRLIVKMEECPPGLVTNVNYQKNGVECVCSASTDNKTYFGILHCGLNVYQAYLTHGYWIGYDDSVDESEVTLRSGYCPRGFCVRTKLNDSEIHNNNNVLLPANRSQSVLNKVVCGEYREGKLCGSCSNNMSVYYHSNNYHCLYNKNCELGILLYVISEIAPVTILFTTVIFFNVKFTSGALNGFIFFVQFIDTMIIDANGFILTNCVTNIFITIYQFLYRMFNLNFFTIDELSFCLWKGANTLDILAFKYVTVVYSIILVILTVLLKNIGYISCFKKQNPSRSSSSSVQGTVIHGFSAFFVMCYSQCAKVTLFILTPGHVHSMGQHYHNKVTKVVFYQGDLQFMHKDHIKYALPAIFFGIVLVLIPTLLLLIYPLCYKVLAFLRIGETRCIQIVCRVLPLERMKPIFDSFQSCFKDKYRFFAGLYFLYRLMALLSFLFTDSLTKFYIALEVQLIVMLTLQATTHPYNRHWHNIVDILLFADLAIINAMTMHNFKKANQINSNKGSTNTVSAIQTILIFIPFLYMLCFIIIQLIWKIKRRQKTVSISEDDTDTLALVDYREMEDSKSL